MDNQNCNIPDCVKELSLLKSLIYTLELKLKNLGLENLKDVAYCLNPKIGDTLIYNGSTWVAEKGSGGGGSNVSVESLLSDGNPIAKITVDGEEHTINESNIEVESLINEGTPIAKVTINGTEEHYINESVVSVNPLITEGTSIAKITVNGTTHTIKLAPGGEGNLDNIKVNNITGTVNNKIAEVTVTGNDVEVSTFTEPDKTNEELEIESSDKVTEALAKLLKALKDDEAAVVLAFLSVENSTGFNDNLEYVPETAPSMLANATDLTHADSILRTHIETLELAILTIRNTTLTLTKGASGTFNALTTGSKTITIPWGGNTTNLMKDYPPENGNYYADIQTVLSASEVRPLLSGGDLFPGRCITFATESDPNVTGRDIWKTYLYVGPLEDDTVSYTHYTNINYWKEIA